MSYKLVSILTWVAALVAVFALAPVSTRGQGEPEARGAPFPRQLTAYDRQGTVLRTLGEIGDSYAPEFSPDGMRLAVSRDGDIWVFDLFGDTVTNITAGTAGGNTPVCKGRSSESTTRTKVPPALLADSSSSLPGPSEPCERLLLDLINEISKVEA